MDPTTEQDVEQLMEQIHDVLRGKPLRVVLLALAPMFQFTIVHVAHDLAGVDSLVEALRLAARAQWQADYGAGVN
jgi:hypothetical protein